MNIWYKDYSEFLNELFPGEKVQKISINAGFSCPNRDGTIGTGGCIYCNNKGFSPSYCHQSLNITDQLNSGIQFFFGKYPRMKYLAYFQNYTGTYGKISKILPLYVEALEHPEVVGLIIGTRPDCISDELLDALREMNKFKKIIIEYGAETSHDGTLELINRGHTWDDVKRAVDKTVERGIHCGLHFIMGLPGETEEDMMATVVELSKLPISSVKFHHLQVLKDTELEKRLTAKSISVQPFTLDEYLSLCKKIVTQVPRRIAIERFLSSSPPEMVVAPKWGIKNYEFSHLLHNRLKINR